MIRGSAAETTVLDRIVDEHAQQEAGHGLQHLAVGHGAGGAALAPFVAALHAASFCVVEIVLSAAARLVVVAQPAEGVR